MDRPSRAEHERRPFQRVGAGLSRGASRLHGLADRQAGHWKVR